MPVRRAASHQKSCCKLILYIETFAIVVLLCLALLTILNDSVALLGTTILLSIYLSQREEEEGEREDRSTSNFFQKQCKYEAQAEMRMQALYSRNNVL